VIDHDGDGEAVVALDARDPDWMALQRSTDAHRSVSEGFSVTGARGGGRQGDGVGVVVGVVVVVGVGSGVGLGEGSGVGLGEGVGVGVSLGVGAAVAVGAGVGAAVGAPPAGSPAAALTSTVPSRSPAPESTAPGGAGSGRVPSVRAPIAGSAGAWATVVGAPGCDEWASEAERSAASVWRAIRMTFGIADAKLAAASANPIPTSSVRIGWRRLGTTRRTGDKGAREMSAA
jgi:hypothetical protein